MEVKWIDAETKPEVGRYNTSKQLVLLLNSGNIVTGYWHNEKYGYNDYPMGGWYFDGLTGSKEYVIAWLDGLQHDYIKES